MKTIPLTRRLVALVDDEDFERANQYKWCASGKNPNHNNYTYYALRNTRLGENSTRTQIMLHTFLMNTPDGLEVDHVDGNGLNNQKSNLRICKRFQNQMNKRCANRHGFKGLIFQASRKLKPWQAQIVIDGKKKNIGRFTNRIDAAIAYNTMAAKHFGDFARLNPIPFTYD